MSLSVRVRVLFCAHARAFTPCSRRCRWVVGKACGGLEYGTRRNRLISWCAPHFIRVQKKVAAPLGGGGERDELWMQRQRRDSARGAKGRKDSAQEGDKK